MFLKEFIDCDWQEFEFEGVLFFSLEKLVVWGCSNSLWLVIFGLVCCVIEMMSFINVCNDMSCFGFEVFCVFFWQVDVMIVVGCLSKKMVLVMCWVYDQMFDFKWVISMGVCVSLGGMFNNYVVVQNVDSVVLVDIFVFGCLFCFEVLIYVVMQFQKKVCGEVFDQFGQ